MEEKNTEKEQWKVYNKILKIKNMINYQNTNWLNSPIKNFFQAILWNSALKVQE